MSDGERDQDPDGADDQPPADEASEAEADAPSGDAPGDGGPGVDAAIARLEAAWPSPEMTDAQRGVYRDVLADVDPAAVNAAVESLLREGREERPPPGLVRTRALDGDRGSRGLMRWLPAAVLALAVAAAVISIVLAVRGGDDPPSDTLPDADRLEQLLSDWDWQAGLATQSVGCERISDERAVCDVLFTTGDTSRVSVVPGNDPGELVVDVAPGQGAGTSPRTTPAPGATTGPGTTAP